MKLNAVFRWMLRDQYVNKISLVCRKVSDRSPLLFSMFELVFADIVLNIPILSLAPLVDFKLEVLVLHHH